jgi:GT2 family glycosyltransferase
MGTQAHRKARLLGFLSGVKRGLTTPVEPRTGHYMPIPMADRAEDRHRSRRDRDEIAAHAFDIQPVITDRAPARLVPVKRVASADRVSIVMPNWNARPFLERALTSLVSKTTYPYELIVVDNGSTDGSKDFIRSFLRDHPRIDSTLIDNRENLYFSTATNQGFQESSSDSKYVALYCNDVEATGETWLQDLVEAVQPPDTIAAGHTGIEAITDRQRGVFFSYDPEYPEPGVKERLTTLLSQPGATYTHLYGYCFLLKRDLLHRTGLYLHTGPFRQTHSDWELYMRFAVMNYRIASVPIKVHHWHSISELLAFYPDLYQDLLRRIENAETLERYLRGGRPFYEAESGFRSTYATPMARLIERLKRHVRGEMPFGPPRTQSPKSRA